MVFLCLNTVEKDNQIFGICATIEVIQCKTEIDTVLLQTEHLYHQIYHLTSITELYDTKFIELE
mgnify:CR=1 FL=1